jgi:hypothetical protein
MSEPLQRTMLRHAYISFFRFSVRSASQRCVFASEVIYGAGQRENQLLLRRISWLETARC